MKSVIEFIIPKTFKSFRSNSFFWGKIIHTFWKQDRFTIGDINSVKKGLALKKSE